MYQTLEPVQAVLQPLLAFKGDAVVVRGRLVDAVLAMSLAIQTWPRLVAPDLRTTISQDGRVGDGHGIYKDLPCVFDTRCKAWSLTGLLLQAAT
jgi:hypothetical protein